MTQDSKDRRAAYAEVGAAMRAAIERLNAVRPRPSTIERCAFDAVISMTASYSRLTDRVYLGQVAALTYSVERSEKWQQSKTSEALRRLASWGVIVAEPPRGRPPKGYEGPAYVIGLPKAVPEHGSTSHEKVTPDPRATYRRKVTPDPGQKVTPDLGPPTEEVSREELPRPRRGSAPSERKIEVVRELEDELGLPQSDADELRAQHWRRVKARIDELLAQKREQEREVNKPVWLPGGGDYADERSNGSENGARAASAENGARVTEEFMRRLAAAENERPEGEA